MVNWCSLVASFTQSRPQNARSICLTILYNKLQTQLIESLTVHISLVSPAQLAKSKMAQLYKQNHCFDYCYFSVVCCNYSWQTGTHDQYHLFHMLIVEAFGCICPFQARIHSVKYLMFTFAYLWQFSGTFPVQRIGLLCERQAFNNDDHFVRYCLQTTTNSTL